MTKTEIDFLIIDFLNGVLTPDKEEQLKKWINASQSNASYFTKTVGYWELSPSLKKSKKFNVDKGWKKLTNKINPKISFQKIVREYSKIAAIFLIAFMASFYSYQFILEDNQQSETAMIVNEVPLGSKSLVTLPDGTNVWINAGSKLIYSAGFNQSNRRLTLFGEAFFDVVTDKSKPFFVETHGLEVKATGTQFNVRAYQDEDFIETTLVEGKISVNRLKANKNDEVVLAPRQKLTVYKHSKKYSLEEAYNINKHKKAEGKNTHHQLAIKKVEIVSNIDTKIYTSWKDEEWIIKKEKLGSLAEKLERRYDAKFKFIDEFIKEYSYSGTLKDETLEQVLHVISQTSPIMYKLDKKDVTIWHKPKNEKTKIIKK